MRKKFPYSQAAKILAVSYTGSEVSAPLYGGNLIGRLTFGLVIDKTHLDYSTLIEFKELDSITIDKLTKHIYNTDYKIKLSNYVTIGHSCYEPHNAFIFLNSSGDVIDFLEICFECKQYRSMYGKLHLGEYCTQKFDMLKKCFTDLGINYGTLKDPMLND